MLSTRVPLHLQGRVFQAIMTIANLAAPLGYLVAGPIFLAVGLSVGYSIIAILATVAGINFLMAVWDSTQLPSRMT
jgi:hypothetical protein